MTGASHMRGRRWRADLSPSEETVRAVSAGAPDTLIPIGRMQPGSVWWSTVEAIKHFGERLPQIGEERICPFIQQALEVEAVLGGSVRAGATEPGLRALVSQLIRSFAGIGAVHRYPDFLSLVVRVPIDCEDVTTALVEDVHRSLKLEALQHGTLLGEFAPGLRGGGTRYAQIPTRQTSSAFLVVRKLLKADAKYVQGRVAWLGEYYRQFPDQIEGN